MNINFNRQFFLLDYRLLDNRGFLKFLSSSESATYFVLRRHTWRSSERHYMGLQDLYLKDKLLASSLTRDKISEVTGVAPDNVSRHLSSLEAKGIIKRMRTGRQNIFILGEWLEVKVNPDSKAPLKVEWFYLEGVYGVSKSDLTESVRSDPTNSSDQESSDQTRQKTSDLASSKPSDQTRPTPSDNNIENNKEENTVNGKEDNIENKTIKGNQKKPGLAGGIIKHLKDLDLPKSKKEYLAQQIAQQLNDQKSLDFFRLVAAKIPEHVIFQTLSEIEHDGGVDNPRTVFTYRMGRYAALTASNNKDGAMSAN